jgi:transcriptional regulator with PAS, ATPase and Fis domain
MNTPKMLGMSESMKKVFSMIEKAAPSRCTVLIRGESGTGKELVARAIHDASPRRDKPFVSLDCGALPENLLEDELFGHVKGAFTDASKDKPGRFEMAHGGTLFLDELGNTSPAFQVKLLRVLQERRFERLGGTKTIETDVRIVAATNANLEEMVQDGTFRKDLYYRLNVITLSLPPLQEREGDLEILVEHFIRCGAEELGVQPKRVDDEVMALLEAYAWPGNVRELQNVIERCLIMAEGREVILKEDLPEMLLGEVQEPSRQTLQTITIPDEGICLKSMVSSLERALILKSLEKTHGNRNRAAALLKLKRTTLVEKLKRIGILGEETFEGEPVAA